MEEIDTQKNTEAMKDQKLSQDLKEIWLPDEVVNNIAASCHRLLQKLERSNNLGGR